MELVVDRVQWLAFVLAILNPLVLVPQLFGHVLLSCSEN
jgi:membrane-associated protease RseP (regulator of RpoE activity)